MPEAVETIINTAAAEAVGENLDWNLRAYGKAWTGEGEDTDFIVGGVAKAVIGALYDNGYYVAALDDSHEPEASS